MHTVGSSYRKILCRRIVLHPKTLQQSYATQKVNIKSLTELIDNSKP
jgi:hypothetical protein